MKKRDQYIKLVEWSEEDQCCIGSVPGWIGRCCYGEKEEEVFHDLCGIVDEWIEIYKNAGIELPDPTNRNNSGKFKSYKPSTKFKKLRGIATAKMTTDEIMSLTRTPEIQHDSQPITRIST
ncbi:hypothetical protein GMJAKD_10850 [Candidatus Electrothrix aarhusensis]|jgi:hypothetical protein